MIEFGKFGDLLISYFYIGCTVNWSIPPICFKRQFAKLKLHKSLLLQYDIAYQINIVFSPAPKNINATRQYTPQHVPST